MLTTVSEEYIERIKKIIEDAKDGESLYGNLDISYIRYDGTEAKISTCFLCVQESNGFYTVSVIMSSFGQKFKHLLRLEKFSDFSRRYIIDRKGNIMRCIKKKYDCDWEDSVQDVTSVYSRTWTIKIG